MKKNKCAWTNKWSAETITINISNSFGQNKPVQHMQFHVLPDHETDLLNYINNIFRFGPSSTIVILIGTLSLPLLRIIGLRQWDGIVFIALGLMLIIWPFTTTLVTVQTLGARNTIRLTRIAALLLTAFGSYRLWNLA